MSHVRDRVPGAVYVGRAVASAGVRASPFANPTRIGPGVDWVSAVWRYHNHLLVSPALAARLPEMWGRTVACWCRLIGEPRTPANVFHGDVLAA